MKKKTIIIISVSLVIVSLIVSALLISYNKFLGQLTSSLL